MNIVVVKNQEEAAEKALELVKAGLEKGSIKTLGLATGSTPLKLYEKMRGANLDCSDVATVNLDEYVGLAPNDPQSYNHYMKTELFDHVKFKETHLPNGVAENLQEECERYEAVLSENPVDLQVLGIGTNAHIGFNEPGTSFDTKTHVVELTESTIESNKVHFEKIEDVPTHAISMGIASIMEAKEIVLLAFGEAKAEAVKQMVNGPVNEGCPASVLQNHANVTIIIDEAAASKL